MKKDKYIKALRVRMRDYIQAGNKERAKEIKTHIAKLTLTVIVIEGEMNEY